MDDGYHSKATAIEQALSCTRRQAEVRVGMEVRYLHPVDPMSPSASPPPAAASAFLPPSMLSMRRGFVHRVSSECAWISSLIKDVDNSTAADVSSQSAVGVPPRTTAPPPPTSVDDDDDDDVDVEDVPEAEGTSPTLTGTTDDNMTGVASTDGSPTNNNNNNNNNTNATTTHHADPNAPHSSPFMPATTTMTVQTTSRNRNSFPVLKENTCKDGDDVICFDVVPFSRILGPVGHFAARSKVNGTVLGMSSALVVPGLMATTTTSSSNNNNSKASSVPRFIRAPSRHVIWIDFSTFFCAETHWGQVLLRFSPASQPFREYSALLSQAKKHLEAHFLEEFGDTAAKLSSSSSPSSSFMETHGLSTSLVLYICQYLDFYGLAAVAGTCHRVGTSIMPPYLKLRKMKAGR
eukprot:PhM_4_TR15226/c1_g1_i1/m.48182